MIFDLKKIKYVDLKKLKIGKYTLLERKGFLEKKLDYNLNENDYVIYCTSLYKDYFKNLKSYVFKEKETSITYALPIELVVFPLGFKTILWCQFLPSIWQKLQNLLSFNYLKRNVLIPKEYSSFLKNEFNNKKIKFNIPVSLVLLLHENIAQFFNSNNASFVDLETIKDISESVLKIKQEKHEEKNRIKRMREQGENFSEDEPKLNKKLHIESQNNQKNCTYLGDSDNYLQMKILGKSNFNSFSLNLKAKNLQSALTFRSFDLLDSYERLEFFGDSILKFLATLEVFFDYPYESEGFLSKKRSKIVSNSFLKKACIKNGIFEFILLGQRSWIPNGLSKNFQNESVNNEEGLFKNNHISIPNKTLADVMESLTAVYYITNGSIDASQRFLNMMGVLKYYKLNYSIARTEEPFIPSKEKNKNLLIEKFSYLEKIIGYKFQNINLLIQAFTHVSFRQIINNVFYFQTNEKNEFNQHDYGEEAENIQKSNSLDNDYQLNINIDDISFFNEKIDKNAALLNKLNPSEFSYDRLEFLGDSIFDFLIVDRLYHQMANENPNGLSLIKAAIVNNHIMSLITLYYKLHHFILFENSLLKTKMLNMEKKIDHFWKDISVYFGENETCVKLMADVFESMIGAIFLDCGMDLKKTESIIMPLAEKFIIKFGHKEFANTSPLNVLKKICEEKKIGIPKIRYFFILI